MISQRVRNECVRFGGHADIEVSYKKTVRSTKRVSNFEHFALFSIGADLRQFWPKTHEDQSYALASNP
jgi:hypothetical protein